MPFKMELWEINGQQLQPIAVSSLDKEERLERWLAADPNVLGTDLLIIGQQVATAYGGRIDLLAMDSQGDLVILELKRDRTPRQIVAQALDYASWVKDLTYQQIAELAARFLKRNLAVAFSETFDIPLPDTINANHSMVIVAAELDDASERIVQYLANEHDVNINVIYFNFFRLGRQEVLGRAWLMDPEEVRERSESRKRPPWSGYYFVNVGEGPHRNWDDNQKYGFIGAGQGPKHSRSLQNLQPGDEIFAYMKGEGYVGYGKVVREAVPIKKFWVEKENSYLLDLRLEAPLADDNKDDPELSEWAVAVEWLRTFPREEAKTFKGVFANQNIVCKLRHEPTVAFVEREFGLRDEV